MATKQMFWRIGGITFLAGCILAGGIRYNNIRANRIVSKIEQTGEKIDHINQKYAQYDSLWTQAGSDPSLFGGFVENLYSRNHRLYKEVSAIDLQQAPKVQKWKDSMLARLTDDGISLGRCYALQLSEKENVKRQTDSLNAENEKQKIRLDSIREHYRKGHGWPDFEVISEDYEDLDRSLDDSYRLGELGVEWDSIIGTLEDSLEFLSKIYNSDDVDSIREMNKGLRKKLHALRDRQKFMVSDADSMADLINETYKNPYR